MKKILMILVILLITATTASAQTSDDAYMRKEVFDVHMQNITSKLDMILEEQKSQRQAISELTKAVAVLSERTDRNFEILSARIEGVNVRIDDLRNGMYLWLVLIGTVITLAGVIATWPKAKNMLQNRSVNKKYLTVEEVERLIEAHLNTENS